MALESVKSAFFRVMSYKLWVVLGAWRNLDRVFLKRGRVLIQTRSRFKKNTVVNSCLPIPYCLRLLEGGMGFWQEMLPGVKQKKKYFLALGGDTMRLSHGSEPTSSLDDEVVVSYSYSYSYS